MSLDIRAGTTPLSSRQNPIIYAVLLIALVIIAVCAAVWFLMLMKKKTEENPEWIEAEKKRPTKHSDIIRLSKLYAINQNDIPLLWAICKTYQVPNLFYSIKRFDELDCVFKQAYNDFKIDGQKQKINRLFLLKFKLDKIFAESVNISSTAALSADTKLSLVLQNGTKIGGTVKDNAKDYIAVSLPQEFLNSKERPEPLEKAAFTFHSPTGMPYAFITRIIRYEKKDDGELMIISHSTDLIKKTQRSFKRKSVKEPCRIASVKTEKDKNGVTAYIPTGNKISTTLLNISGGGCCISSSLPIKEGQVIYTEFDLFDGSYPAIGKIVKTRKSLTEGVYNLHIHFINISVEVQNKILAKVYSYD